MFNITKETERMYFEALTSKSTYWAAICLALLNVVAMYHDVFTGVATMTQVIVIAALTLLLCSYGETVKPYVGKSYEEVFE